MSGDLLAPGGAADLADGAAYPPADWRLATPSGRTISARTAWRARNSVPRGTRSGRRSRVRLFSTWCTERGRVAVDPGTVPDYLTHLADLRHPASTLVAHLGTLAGWLSMVGHPLDEEDRRYCRAVIDHRAAAEATEPAEAPGALQAAEISPENLAAMVAKLDRTTVRGVRDWLTLVLHWHMAGRASEPAGLNRHDTTRTLAKYTDPATGRPVERAALLVKLRVSKTNPTGRRAVTVRLLAQDTEALCPVAAWEAWTALVDAQQAGQAGPLLRRVDRHGRIAVHGIPAPGRPPVDPRRGAGIGDRTVRNLIAACAQAAGLVRAWEPEQWAVLSTLGDAAALAGLDAERRDALRAELRLRRRELRRGRARYAGHSMRRGNLRALQRRGVPREAIEQHGRYVPGSRALARYLDEEIDWSQTAGAALRL
ncbi:hypothetical protein EDD99_8104 [Streptomyces sp. 846.5]|nr:hypothetical protein [Streptomyces sp. 846.5]TDT93295.1 hypothetical protein EDD99_8104 [Streptomyces sp. 846.5]